jgi:hypothetical protein
MHYKESGGIDLQQQKEEKMAESSYNSKGEQMAWDDREIIAQFLCRDEAAIKNTFGQRSVVFLTEVRPDTG